MQTNETQRCVALVPAFLTLARESGLPLDLVELGPSAGLNLVFDRYGYRYAEGTFGDPGGTARHSTRPSEGASRPLCSRRPLEIGERRGIDLVADRRRDGGWTSTLLHSFLWPGLDRAGRRLDAAIETFLAAPDATRANPG